MELMHNLNKYDKLIKYYAYKLCNKMRAVTFDDFMSEGRIAVWKGLISYNPAIGKSFNTYISYKIYHRMVDFCRILLGRKKKYTGFVISFDVVEPSTLGYSIEDDIIQSIDFNMLIDKLPHLYAFVMRSIYLQGMHRYDVAKILNFHPSRISQIHTESIKIMKAYVEGKKITKHFHRSTLNV